MLDAVMCNSCRKTGPVFANTKSLAGLVVFLRFALVFNVVLLGHISQILKAIVGAVTVHVVNLAFGPLASHVQPRQSMTLVSLAVNRGYEVSFSGKTSRHGTYCCPGLFKFPSENARVRIVVKDLLESVLRQHAGTLTHFRKDIKWPS